MMRRMGVGEIRQWYLDDLNGLHRIGYIFDTHDDDMLWLYPDIWYLEGVLYRLELWFACDWEESNDKKVEVLDFI